MFIPAMIYASFQSRLNEISVEAVPIDSGNFGTAGKGIAAAVAVSVATVAASVLCDPLKSHEEMCPRVIPPRVGSWLISPLTPIAYWLTAALVKLHTSGLS